MYDCGMDGKWQVQKHRGQSLPRTKKDGRPWGMPCIRCPKSGTADTPRPDRELTEESRAVHDYYLLCEADATGLLPRDLLVVENNSWVKRVLSMIERSKPDQGMLMLMAMMAKTR